MEILILILIIFLVTFVYMQKNKETTFFVSPLNQTGVVSHNNPIILEQKTFPSGHPVLTYQRDNSSGIWPANWGDPIRIPDLAGPYGSMNYTKGKAYDKNYPGPIPGKPLNIPVPMGSLKETNENYNHQFFKLFPPSNASIGTPQSNASVGAYPAPFNFPPQNKNISGFDGDYFKPYGPNMMLNNIPFVGSVNSYAPFPEVNTPWEKVGILTSITGNEIMNLYRRPIAPLQNLFEYNAQDKNGFLILLKNRNYLENNDVVDYIPGKEKNDPWRVHIFNDNKYIWV